MGIIGSTVSVRSSHDWERMSIVTFCAFSEFAHSQKNAAKEDYCCHCAGIITDSVLYVVTMQFWCWFFSAFDSKPCVFYSTGSTRHSTTAKTFQQFVAVCGLMWCDHDLKCFQLCCTYHRNTLSSFLVGSYFVGGKLSSNIVNRNNDSSNLYVVMIETRLYINVKNYVVL